MQNSDYKTDGLFREKLLNHEVVPPPEVWDGIVKSMDEKNNRKRLILILGFSAAASLLLAFLAGWYFAAKQPEGNVMQAELLPKTTTVVPSHEKIGQAPEKQSTDQQPAKQNIAFSSDNYWVDRTEGKKLTEEKTLSPTKSLQEKIEACFLVSSGPVILKGKENSFDLIAMNDEGFSVADRAIIARNMENQQKTAGKKKSSSWAVGVQASPVYRFDQPSSNDLASNADYAVASATNSGSNYVTNVAGGVCVEYRAGNRLSVQSGVNYGEIAQNPGVVGVSFAGQNWLNDSYKMGNEGVVTNSSNSRTLNTPMGVTNIILPSGADLASVSSSNTLVAEATKSYELEQQAGYLEIPLLLRYKVLDKKIGLLVLGGINTNVLLSNNASLSDGDEVIANGEIDGLTPLTFSSSIGMGLDYSLSKRFRLSVEPTMKIQLTSLNKQRVSGSKPYTVGLFTGISYNF